jgi:hypothetical protein
MVFRLKAQASWRSIVYRIAQPRSKTSAGDFFGKGVRTGYTYSAAQTFCSQLTVKAEGLVAVPPGVVT